METISHPQKYSSHEIHTEARLSNAEQAIINLNSRFDKFEDSISKKIDNISTDNKNTSQRLFEKIDNLTNRELETKQWKSSTIISVVSFVWIAISAIIGFTIIQTNEIRTNKINHKYSVDDIKHLHERIVKFEKIINAHDVSLSVFKNELYHIQNQKSDINE